MKQKLKPRLLYMNDLSICLGVELNHSSYGKPTHITIEDRPSYFFKDSLVTIYPVYYKKEDYTSYRKSFFTKGYHVWYSPSYSKIHHITKRHCFVSQSEFKRFFRPATQTDILGKAYGI